MLQNLLNARLKELGMRQAQLARETGLSKQYVSELCSGTAGAKMPVSTVRKLADALQVPREEIEDMVSGRTVTVQNETDEQEGKRGTV